VLMLASPSLLPAHGFTKRSKPITSSALLTQPNHRESFGKAARRRSLLFLLETSDREPETTTAAESKNDDNDEVFENNGPFAWLIPYMKVGGYKEGKALTYAIFAKDVATEEDRLSTPEESKRIQAEAALDPYSIGPAERERRDQAGKVVLALAAVVAAYIALFNDNGDLTGHFNKLAAWPLFFIGVGLRGSAKTGL